MTKSQFPKGIVKDIIIVVIGVAVIWFSLQAVFGTENPFYVVSSRSMVPELEVFDVLVVNGNVPFEEIEIADVIVFNRPSGQDRVIVHRVVSITDDDPFTLRTKGDANPASIPGTDFPITEEEYIGKVWQVIPQVGYITRILTPPINYIIIAVIIGIMIFKQIAKSKKEKELSSTFTFDSNNGITESETANYNEISEAPTDNEYVTSSKEIKKLDDDNVIKPDDGVTTKDSDKKSED